VLDCLAICHCSRERATTGGALQLVVDRHVPGRASHTSYPADLPSAVSLAPTRASARPSWSRPSWAINTTEPDLGQGTAGLQGGTACASPRHFPVVPRPQSPDRPAPRSFVVIADAIVRLDADRLRGSGSTVTSIPRLSQSGCRSSVYAACSAVGCVARRS
jgi:hypothetical protein